MRNLFLAMSAAVALSFTPLAHAAEFRIAVVNTQRILNESAPAVRAVQKLKKEFEPRQMQIQKLTTQVRDLQATLEKQGASMNEADRRKNERDLADLSLQLQHAQRDFSEDLTLARNQAFASVSGTVQKAIVQVGQSGHYDLIVDKGSVLYASPRADITDKVIRALANK